MQHRKSDFSKVLSTIEKLNDNGFSRPDESMFWKPEQDKLGNAFATIRFLPEREDSLPFVRIFSHGFQGPTGKWLIENCPTTLGHECGICESNSLLWNDNDEQAKTIVRQRKRKLSYIANIMVVEDPKHPENNGKTFLFKFGKKIYEKIVDKIKPQFQDETPYNPFCPYTGADFKLKMRRVENYPNYDKSEFSSPAPICGGDEALIDTVLNSMFVLEDQIAPALFKSSKELTEKMNKVLNVPTTHGVSEDDIPAFEQSTPAPIQAPKVESPKARPLPKMDLGGDDEDDSNYFAKLAAM